jgi:phosphoesterase RecJ-like protein
VHPGDVLLSTVSQSPSVLLSGPLSPDGDSVGACLALARTLEDRGVRCVVTGDIGYRYDWMPDAKRLVPDADLTGSWHTVIIMDGDRHRLPERVGELFADAKLTVVVDHHISTIADEYDVAWVQADATSTCEMIYGLLQRAQIPIDHDMATWLHTGTVFDTGGLRHTNTSAATLAMTSHLIACGANHADICRRVLSLRRWRGVRAMASILGAAEPLLEGRLAIGVVTQQMTQELKLSNDDIEGVIDYLCNIVGVEVAILLYERSDNRVKVSLRSHRVDVAAIAASLIPSGGGHTRAAGALCSTSTDQLKAQIVQLVRASLPH